MIDARETVVSTYESIGIVKEFAYNCTTFIFLDPFRNIIEIMLESIKDVTTLRECYLNGLITRGGCGKGKSKVKEKAAEGKGGSPTFDKTVTRKCVNGAFIPVKDIDDSHPQPIYPVTTKWAYDEKSIHYRISQFLPGGCRRIHESRRFRTNSYLHARRSLRYDILHKWSC